MMQLMALAMNPNLTEADFLELLQRAMDNRLKLLQTAREFAESLPPDQRQRYVMMVLPMLLSLP